jgi:hypothetical protein
MENRIHPKSMRIVFIFLLTTGCSNTHFKSALSGKDSKETTAPSSLVRVGDMRLSLANVRKSKKQGKLNSAVDYLSFESTKWPLGIIPVQFDTNITSAQKLQFMSACRIWEAEAGVKCSARTLETQYLHVTNQGSDSGCFSDVGERSDGKPGSVRLGVSG